MEVILTKSNKNLLTIALLGFMTAQVSAENPDFNFSAKPISKNVYSIISPSYGRPSAENKGWNSNSHFVVTNKGVLVFDTGSSQLIGKGIIKAIKSVTKQPILWVVNSHSHADHWLGNAAFVDIGAEVISTKASMESMKKDGQGVVDAFSRMTEGATDKTHIAYPTQFLSKKETRTLGGVEFEFFYSNDGHSLGDVLMWLPKQRIIFGGDVLNSDWMPIMTPNGNVPNLITSLNKVEKLNPAIVLPGHGKPTSIDSITRDAEVLSAVWNLVKAGHKKGKKADEILAQVREKFGPKYSSLYKDFDSNTEYFVSMMYKKQS
jgi:glyoxylase-like metal-dependent hydrolase (beta-lactamase superfamily II)